MKRPLYIFNPEHDLALANNDPNFNAPLSALQLASDLEHAAIWYSQPESNVLCRTYCDNDWLKSMKKLFPQLTNIDFVQTIQPELISEIHPWGWDKAIIKYISTHIDEDYDGNKSISFLLPDDIKSEKIRDLSHRKTAINAHRFLLYNIKERDFCSNPAVIISSANEVIDFTDLHSNVVFKAPWSGSGKGLFWMKKQLSKSQLEWCSKIIDKQESIIGEKAYHVVQNFAMLFSCKNKETSFAGYSLFETEKGTYRSNLLLNNDQIFNLLTQKWINPEVLEAVQLHLKQFIETEISPFYSGILGVDMFVYEENNRIKLHPCVEINLRMTMGAVARTFYDRFVQPETQGYFQMEYFPEKQTLWNNHLQRLHDLPLIVEKGKIISGYLSLSNVHPNAHYRLKVEIYKNSVSELREAE